MAETNENCIICDNSLSSGPVHSINKETIKNFIRASKKRRDEKHLRFRGKDSLIIHANCAKSYTSTKQINYAKKRFSQMAPASTTSVATVTRSTSTKDFDFKNLCLMCQQDAAEIFIEQQRYLPKNERKKVHIVSSNDEWAKLMSLLDCRSDKGNLKVYDHLMKHKDLVAVGARYHEYCYSKLFVKRSDPFEGGDEKAVKVAKFVTDHILQHKNQLQFSLKKILEDFEGDYWVNARYLKTCLRRIFGRIIILHYSDDNSPIITFQSRNGKRIMDDLGRKNDKKSQKMILDLTAAIIRDDIKEQVPDTSSDSFEENCMNEIPKSLQVLLSVLLLQDPNPDEESKKRIIPLAHSIIAATGLRKKQPTFQLGLASTVKNECDSQELLDELNSLGICSSYEDTLKETQAMSPEEKIKLDKNFAQFTDSFPDLSE